MAAPTVTTTVTLRSGEKQEFCHPIDSNNGTVTYQKLRESLQIVQSQVNEYLTVQVDLEKGLNQQNSSRNDNDENVDGESKGEREEDEDETNEMGQGDREPPQKKPKT